MDKIRAPYNFVPLAPRVVFPDWSDVPANDVPFEDGVSGTIQLMLRVHTPLFIRGSSPDTFFTSADNTTPAIPGSSLRGMIRNVVEIASFGKLSRFNDHRYGVRDLHNREVYTQYMSDLMVPVNSQAGKKVTMPLVDAGWLRKTGEDSAEIVPCDFAKIHYNELMAEAARRGLTRFVPGNRQSGPDKYRAWGAPDGSETARTLSTHFRPIRDRGAGFLSEYGIATLGGTARGQLVFTGQPQPWRKDDTRSRAKQHDFVFYESKPSSRPLDVSPATLSDFRFIHSDRGQQGRMVDDNMVPNEEWGFWTEVFEDGGRIPVFFIRWPEGSELAGQLRAFGLAMMFRLAYKHTIGDAVQNTQPSSKAERLDLADLIFGTVLKAANTDDDGDVDDDRTIARRGRVSFGMLTANTDVKRAARVTDMVLSAPKASYYPNYIEQGLGYGDRPAQEKGGARRYQTLMDDDVRVRGWKRYRPQEVVRDAPRPTRSSGAAMDLSRIATNFTPVSGGTFSGEIRFHNLRRVELGALIWALDFGGAEGCYHTLGLAKSFGYGRITLELESSDLRANNGASVGLDAVRSDFAEWMEAQLKDTPGGWNGSVHIQDLLALARPIPAKSDDGRHMLLNHPTFRNEFVEAKKAYFALAPVGRAQEEGAISGNSSRSEVARQSAMQRPGESRRDHTVPSARSQAPTQDRDGASGKRPWPGLAAGTQVRAKIIGTSNKGKPRVELLDYQAYGVVGAGPAPSDVSVGVQVDVLVIGTGNPANLNLRWPDDASE